MNAYRLRPLNFPWPPLLYGAAFVAAILLDHMVGRVPVAVMTGPLTWLAGGLTAVFALTLDIWAVRTLMEFHTTIMPHRCACRLVTTGPFRFTRNPIYLGYTLMMIALGLLTGNPWFFLAAPAAAVATTLMAIRCEEMHLLARFGVDFERYCRRTRRWI